MGIILLAGGAVAAGAAVVVGAENMRVSTKVLVLVFAGVTKDKTSLHFTYKRVSC